MSDAKNSLAVRELGARSGLEVVDRIEQQRYAIHTPEPVTTRPTATEGFRFPVGRAVSFETTALTLPTVVGVFVHDASGDIVADVDHSETVTLEPAEYSLELSTQIKTYLQVEAALQITSDSTETTIRFVEPTTVQLGVRSRHDHPAATVTTTADPRDIMAAVETFGSALKAQDPERAYPTLRGHPPSIELGDELAIPDGLAAPDTGITLELPADLESIYVAAPLAYYLGASLEPAPTPRLVTDEGFTYDLDGPRGYETTVANVLKQVFFLDCVTRTEGLYQLPLDERKRIEPVVDLDFEALYDRPLSEQVAAYLDVPFAVVESSLPEWPLTTHVDAVPETVEQLPFVVDELATIRSAGPAQSAGTDATEQVPAMARDDVLTRSASEGPAPPGEFVQPTETEAVEQAWIGDEIPIGASKLTTEGFRNRLDRDVTEGDIEIAIVVNDDRMVAEGDVVDQVYGDREDLPFDVSVHQNTTVDELESLLSQQRGFLHYIGHTEHDGFECSDGKLDAETLDDVAVDAFLLNACQSYNQGLALIEAGAIGGIVTLNEVLNDGAVRIGESVARLLNCGFPLRAALTIARDESILGGQYIVVGDGGVTVTQPEGGTPNMLKITPRETEFEVFMNMYPTDVDELGAITMPLVDGYSYHHLASGEIGPLVLDRAELEAFLVMQEVPVQVGDELRWSTSLDLTEAIS